MNVSTEFDDTDTDLAQLLVLETGRLLEYLTPQLAVRLPDSQAERLEVIGSALASLDITRSLIAAAIAHASSDSTG